MKSKKILMVATLSLVAAALLISTVAAMPVGYSSNSAYGGMGSYNHAQSNPSTQHYQSGSSFSFGNMMGWFGNGFNQMMRWFRW